MSERLAQHRQKNRGQKNRSNLSLLVTFRHIFLSPIFLSKISGIAFVRILPILVRMIGAKEFSQMQTVRVVAVP